MCSIEFKNAYLCSVPEDEVVEKNEVLHLRLADESKFMS
jgi:hypothetical protein